MIGMQEELIGFVCVFLFIYWMFMGLPWIDYDPKELMDSNVKTTEEWEDENMTNKERVAKWREEKKKND